MNDLEKRFAAARRRAIATDYAHLNPRQLEGVLTTEGPLLLLAGAGSGKTTVLINRVANLLRYGRGSDTEEIPLPISQDEVEFLEQYAAAPDPEQRPLMQYLCAVEPARPWEVLAITFTNKAANELKDRLERMLGEEARDALTEALPFTIPTTASGSSRIFSRRWDWRKRPSRCGRYCL